MSNCRDVIPLYFNDVKATLHIYYESQGEETQRYEAFMATMMMMFFWL
jgi:hypothetical protein